MRSSTPWVAALLSVISCSKGPASEERVWLSYEPTVVQLRGRLTVSEKYGPPNYGENPESDEKLLIPILHLDHPANVRGDPNSETNVASVEDVQEMQVVFLNGDLDYGPFVGKKVRVRGTLFAAQTGHHYTKVLIIARQLRVAD